MVRWINADTRRTVMVYDDEHEENILKKMTVAEMCYAFTEEGIPIIFSGLKTYKWIPCSKKMPNIGEGVLVTVKIPLMTKIYICTLMKNEENKEYYWINEESRTIFRHDAVVAWMPLPKAYKIK